MRFVSSYVRKLRVPGIIAGIVLTLFVGISTPALAAPQAHSASTSSAGKFEYHLIKQGSPMVTHGSTKKPSGDTSHSVVPYYTTIDCLNVYMSLSNPQTDVVEVYVQVQNYCSTVSSLTLDWDTGGKCNGVQYLGPHDGYNIGTLAYGVGWAEISDWSTVCWGTTFPYYPVSFTMSGFADANGIISAEYRATGSYDTRTYTFI